MAGDGVEEWEEDTEGEGRLCWWKSVFVALTYFGCLWFLSDWPERTYTRW